MRPATQLYLVPTPIGNLGDITYRAVDILKQVDCILAEDTRTSKKLLRHWKIDQPIRSYHSFNEHQKLAGLIERLKQGESMALITDAGTPGISDPGFLLVRACLEQGILLECLPGATAFVPALIKSGLPADRFVFEGFLPVKKGRKTRLGNLIDEPRTMIFYESPHRLHKTLFQFQEIFGPSRPASVSRELTKVFEETINGTLLELITHFNDRKVKGEIVIVVAGSRRSK
ncbi:MAG: 16S rRNA (cytidine(1402)-2'-O)-methyltransferase [Cyclobacteriaceae bacterium]